MKTLNGRCNACEVLMIDVRRCHETGCPEAWRDYKRACKWCGSEFVPEDRDQQFDDESCAESYGG